MTFTAQPCNAVDDLLSISNCLSVLPFMVAVLYLLSNLKPGEDAKSISNQIETIISTVNYRIISKSDCETMDMRSICTITFYLSSETFYKINHIYWQQNINMLMAPYL
mmetsp:Transcript_19425/g.17639  ORF Transcript_19425/g.17639 Transcript_19425/m.17639 type:complete len:108 (+) Transcript_19425:130-453(+)